VAAHVSINSERRRMEAACSGLSSRAPHTLSKRCLSLPITSSLSATNDSGRRIGAS
jgi:hypothetical protein